MEVEDAFEKWISDWVARNPGGDLSAKTVWFVASRWGHSQNADKIAALEAERDALRADSVARTNTTGLSERLIAAIEGECDGLGITNEQATNILAYLQYGAQMDDDKADAKRYRFLRDRDIDTMHKGGVFAGMTPQNIVMNGADLDAAIDAAIAAKEPNRD